MLGTSITSAPWKVQVDSQAMKRLPDGTGPHGGKQFLVLNVAIQNVGASGALLVQPNQFKLQAMNGATVKPYSTSLVAFNAQDVRPINVGMGGFTQFVYEIAPDSTGYLFLMTPKPGGSVSMSWNVP